MDKELYKYKAPKCCKDCPKFEQPSYGELGGDMIEPPWCRLGIFLPRIKETCKRKSALVR